MSVLWTPEAVRTLLFAPQRLLTTGPWSDWIARSGGLTPLYQRLRAAPLNAQQREVLEVILAYPGAPVTTYESLLSLERSGYHRRKKALLAILAAFLNARQPNAASAPPISDALDLPLDDAAAIRPLPAGSRMPFSPNPLFTGRDTDVRALAVALAQPASGTTPARVAVTGFGGIGKTSVAVEFAHRYGWAFAGGVFTLACGDPAAVPDEIAACGGPAHLNLHPDFGALALDDQVALVRAAWQAPTPRLLILDNCDDPALVQRWAPTSGGCRLVLTSRRSHWPASLGLACHHLGVLPRSMSVRLLVQLAPQLPAAAAAEIAAELGDFPLALHLAGSFLGHYDHISGADYLAELRDQPLLAHPSLQGRGMDLSPTQHERDVRRTFALSYTRLDASRPVDALALRLSASAACCCPDEPIPLAILWAAANQPATALDATDAMRRLLDLGIAARSGQEALVIHRLIHAYLRMDAPVADHQAPIEEVLIAEAAALNAARDPAALAPLRPHLRWALAQGRGRHDARAAGLSMVVGDDLAALGAYDQAQPLYERALTIRQDLLGAKAPATAASMAQLAAVLQRRGRYDEARPLAERALAIREEALGPQHLETAASLNQVGSLLVAAGEHGGAQSLYERALGIRTAALGPIHPYTARIRNNLAELFRAAGDYEAARPLLEEVLALNEAALGPAHPHTALSLSNLGSLFVATGNYATAQSLYERALAIQEAALGPAHPDTAHSLHKLAAVWTAQGRYAEARPCYERALAIRVQRLGPQHPRTSATLCALADVLVAQGARAAARPLYEWAVASRERHYGREHPATRAAKLALQQASASPGGPEDGTAGSGPI